MHCKSFCGPKAGVTHSSQSVTHLACFIESDLLAGGQLPAIGRMAIKFFDEGSRIEDDGSLHRTNRY